MQKIELVFATSILVGAAFLTPAPAASAGHCPVGCTLCFPTSPLAPLGPCCVEGDLRRLRCPY